MAILGVNYNNLLGYLGDTRLPLLGTEKDLQGPQTKSYYTQLQPVLPVRNQGGGRYHTF